MDGELFFKKIVVSGVLCLIALAFAGVVQLVKFFF